MTRKVATKGLGNALNNARRKKADRLRAEAANVTAVGESASKSVLEESNLDDLIATVELRKQAWSEVIGDTEAVDEGPTLVEPVRRNAAELAASRRRKLVPIPRRPAWSEGMDAEALAAQELEVFAEWRRGLALAASEEGLHLTPYERNLDFWRQLWRCVERSDLVVQIVDARDPDFYYCHDLRQYVAETGSDKRLLLLVNKADFLSAELRRRWTDHFAASGIDAVFFSALHELQKQQKEQVQQQLQERQHARRGGEEELQQEEDEEEQQQQQQQRKNVLLLAQEAVEDPAEAVEDPAAVPVPGLDSSDDELNDPNVDGGGSSSSSSSSSHADAFDEAAGSEKSVEGEEEQDEEEEDSPLGPLDDCDRGIVNSSQLLDELASRLPERDDARQAHRGTIGFVGYPNVGKSTVINALVGAKKVGMSRTPGKTKHIQTLELPEVGVTLCDCPGLVFPSVAASRAHLVINNTMPLDDLKECFSPVTLIVDKMGLPRVLERYGCAGLVRAASERTGSGVLNETRSFLTALALSRGHLLRARVPDEDWAARKVLRDYVVGRLLHCEEPPAAPGQEVDDAEASCGAEAQESHGDADDTKGASSADPAAPAAEEEDDFGDVADFLQEASKSGRPRGMTKRQMRFMNKQCMKSGGMPQMSGKFVGGICTQRLANMS